MSLSLGRAELIVDANVRPLIEAQAVAYKQVRVEAEKATKDIAKQNKVREGDVRASAAIILDEEKKSAKERLAEEKRIATEKQKVTKELLAYNNRLYKQEEAERKARARAIVESEKKIEQERLSEVKRTLQQEATLRRQHNDARRQAAQKAREEESRSQQGGALGTGISGAKIGSTAATLLGFGAIASGALVAREAVIYLIDVTRQQEEAQRSLNAAFGKTSEVYKILSEQYTKQFNLVNSEVAKSIAQFGTLNRQSNLTSQQLKTLIPIAIDLQAAYGGDLREAFRSVQGAILGETEALEKYGIVLQDGVLKTLPQLTADEKKRFETMSESEKQLIRYRVLIALSGEAQGAAAKRAVEFEGSIKALSNAGERLALIFGKSVLPSFAAVNQGLSGLLNKAAELLEVDAEIKQAVEELKAEGDLDPRFLTTLTATPTQKVRDRVERNRDLAERRRDIINEENIRKEAIRDAQKAENARADAENALVKQHAAQQVSILKDAAERRIADIEDQKRAAEAALRIRIDSLDKQKEAELDRIRVIEDARREASEAELRRIEAEKDAAIKGAEDRRDAALRAIEVEKDAVIDAAEEQIRQAEITRDKRLKDIETQRDAAIDRLDDEKRARDELRIKEDRDIEDSIEKEQRLREKAHKNRLRQFEIEVDKLESRYDKEISNIDKQIDKEDDRHKKKQRQLEDEAEVSENIYATQTKLIDDQLAALEALEKAENNRRRSRDLEQRRSEAQQNLIRVQGTGTQEQVAQARAALTGAIRIGDPEYIKKRQQELIEIAGRGSEAIAAAQKELAEIEQDIVDENVDQAREAEKDKLQATKEKLKEEENTHRESLRKQLDEERRAEDDRSTRRKRALEEDKKAARDKLDDAKKKIEERKRLEAEAYEADKEGVKDAVETAKRALDDRRRAEDQKHNDDLERIRDTAKAEIEATNDTYNNEETGIIPNIRRAIDFARKQYEEKARIAKETYEAERTQIYETYDHPETGLIARHRAAEESARKAYQSQTETTQKHFNDLKEQAQQAYRNSDGVSGIIDRLDNLKRDTEKGLRDDLAEWEKWKEGLVGPNGVITKTWDQAKKDFENFLKVIRSRGGATTSPITITVVPSSTPSIVPGPDPGMPGGTNPGGIGTTPSIPPGAPATGSPDPEANKPPTIPEDNISNMFTETFGYGAKYSPNYPSGPGWEGGSAWAGGPSHHKGVDLILSGPQNGYGQPIPAFHDG